MKRAVFTLALFGLLAMGCKQGKGDHCQLDSDCADGLVCTASEPSTCQETTGGGIDATVPPQIDAAVDAPHDSSID